LSAVSHSIQGPPPASSRKYLDQIDYVLLLGVGPYSGKDLFLDDLPAKIKTLLEWKPELLICIDGGVSKNTIAQIANMKPHFVVSGSAIFNNEDPVENLAFFNKRSYRLNENVRTNPRQ
jgi:ribulose-phosphate 3-epimerase